MTDLPTSNDFDDELLSAYLDDELSAEERARVEERLEADPAARRMVDELRAVSRVVQGLPRESLGEDLRGAVLQRAERAMLAPASTRPSYDADVKPLPRLTIGRSARGWIWAGMAVAAALLITVFQPERRHDEKLPDVAAARREPDSTTRRLARENPEMRAMPEQPGPATGSPSEGTVHSSLASAESASPSASTAAPAASPMKSPASAGALAARTDADNQPRPARELQADRLAGTEAGRGAVTEQLLAGEHRDEVNLPANAPHPSPLPKGEGISSSPLPAEQEPSRSEDDMLMVHVNVRPAALRSQAFDRLLVSNGIVVERPADREQGPPPSADESTEAGAFMLMLRTNAGGAEKAAAPQEIDAVLVEAPVAQIEHCLADLDADKDTYLGVMIDEASAADNRAVRELASQRNWQQYNRGQVLRQQVEFGYDRREAQDRLDYGSDGGYAAKGATPSFGASGNFSPTNGRAIRVQTQQIDGRQVVQQPRLRNLAASAQAEVKEDVARGTGAKDTKSTQEMASNALQVLFVLSSEPASSPAAGDSAP
jgi:hypothetical protein